MPTDRALRNLSPFQSLWLYTHIKKEQAEERKFAHDLMRVVCYMVNPAGARKVFEGKAAPNVEQESVAIKEDDFIASIKAMDPNFDVEEYKRKLEEES